MGRALGEELAQLKARARAPELRDLVLGLAAARKMGPIRPVPDKFERLLAIVQEINVPKINSKANETSERLKFLQVPSWTTTLVPYS